jgi:DNA-binding beta-propeller fold protein YncE
MTNVPFVPRSPAGRKIHNLARRHVRDDHDLRAAVHRALAEQRGSAEHLTDEWTRPSLDTRRRVTPPTLADQEDGAMMQPIIGTPTDVPTPLHERRWPREALKLVAAAIAIAIIGTLLVLLLRDNDPDDQSSIPGVAPSEATATTQISPTADATAAKQSTREAAQVAAHQAQTATVSASATANASLPSPGEFGAEIAVGVRPFGIAATDNAIWVAIADEGTVTRIDPTTNRVVATVQVGPAEPDTYAGLSDLAVYAGQVWTINNVDDTLVRIDPATNQVAQEIHVDPAVGSDDFDPFFILVDETGIWITERDANRLLHIDPATGAVLASLDVPLPGWMAAGFGSIWVNTNQDTSDSTIVRIDQATHEIVSDFPLASAGSLVEPGYVVTGAGSVWVSDFSSGKIARIDPTTNTVIATIDSGLGSGQDMAVTETGLWIMASRSTGIERIDLETNQRSQILPYGNGWYLVESDGSIWIAATQDDLVVRINEAP